MTEEIDRKPQMPPLTRREAMLQLLRVGGVAAGAAGLGVWLSEHSFRPVAGEAKKRAATIVLQATRNGRT